MSEAGEAERQARTVDDVLRLLARRAGLIAATVVFVLALSVVVLALLTPRYSARTLVMIEARHPNVVELEAVMAGLGGDAETILSEIEVMRSRGLAEKLIDKLSLGLDPEFNEALRPKGLIAGAIESVEQWIDEAISAPLGAAAPPPPVDTRARVVDAVLERLSVGPVRGSRVVAIAFSSTNAETAARVVNTLADLYVVEQLEAKFEATARATDWLERRVAELREKVAASESAVEEFRKQSGLLQSEGTTITTQQVSELNTQLVLARAERAEAEARLEQIERLMNGSDGVESVAEVLDSPLIQQLRQQEAELKRRAAELSVEYGELHPRMINARAEVAGLEDKIATEVAKIIKGLRNEVEIARTREDTLERSLGGLKQEVASANRSEVQLRALEREANADRMLLDTLLARFKETSEQQQPGIQQPDARIVSKAAVPQRPSWPNKPLVLALAGLGGLVVGVGLALTAESLDRGFRSGDQLERATGVPALALVPAVGGVLGGGRKPEPHMVKNPQSAFGESLRSVYTGLLLARDREPPRTVLVTSVLPREGKSSVALGMVRVQARSGSRMLLIDADLRRPRIHDALGLARSPGLVELLSGEALLEDVVQRDPWSGAEVIAAGRAAPNPPDLLRSEELRQLLANLAQAYDMVVLDSPPSSVASDARVIANRADATMVVVRWAETRREMVEHAIKELRAAGGRIAGAVLSMVNPRRHARYGYGDSGYYYGSLRKYYGR